MDEEESEKLARLARELEELLQEIKAVSNDEVDALMLPGGAHLLGLAQTRLRDSEASQQRLAIFRGQILDALPAHIALLDRNARITFVNEAWRRFGQENGLDADNFGIGMDYISQCTGAHGDSAEQADDVASGIRSVLGREKDVFSLEYPCHSPNEHRWFRVMVTPLTPTEDDGVVVMHVDITERVLAENRLLESETQLRQAQRMEAVGQLTGGIAHDFNNLLTVILGRGEELAERVQDSALRVVVDEIVEASQRAADLTARLLAFGRQQHLNPDRIRVDVAVNNLLRLLQRTLGENIELRVVSEPADLWPVSVDIAQFDSAILNLCINARDAMPAGGRIVIETQNLTIDADSGNQYADTRPGDYILVRVSDSGGGMEPHILERVLEPFFTTKATGEGSGLGLPMVYGFVRQSGGNLRIDSKRDKGTTVHMWFPRAEAPVEAGPGEEPAEVAIAREISFRGRAPKVLLVEDDPGVLRLEQIQLVSLGFDVTSADNGPDALGIAESLEHIDLLLTDLIMPGGMTGADLAVRVRELHPQVRIVFASGYAAAALDDSSSLQDAVFLQKPFQRQALAEAAQRALELPSPTP